MFTTSSTALVGVGLRVYRASNVIIRNVKIQKVLASAGDAIGIQASSQVWVDHVDLSSVSPKLSLLPLFFRYLLMSSDISFSVGNS